MNLDRTHFATAILMVFVGFAAVGQNGLPTSKGKEDTGCVTSSQSSDPSLMIYEDKEDGFQFRYPSSLHLDDNTLQLIDPVNKDYIDLYVGFSSAEPNLYRHIEKDVSIKTQVFGHLRWVNYSSLKWSQYCTF
jgi:hypothetical protein